MKAGKGIQTVIDYLRENGERSFREKPMTEVECLAFSLLSYLKFDGMVPGVKERKKAVTLESLAERPDFENLYADTWFEKEYRALIEGMLAGKRYRNIKLNYYVNVLEKESEIQFSAITLRLDDGTVFLSFRGTDESIVGWKEDFNMAFLTPVAGQEKGVKYVNMVASRLRKPFYIGGHSKGGNLAVYSAMNCKPEVQDRIVQVFSMDGPGFRPEIMDRGNYGKIKDRVVKILPHSSLVGMLFESDMHFEVVESKTFGLVQHDAFTWVVEGEHLKRVQDIYKIRKKMDNTLNTWILSLNEEQLRTFVDTLYEVISASEVDDLMEFTADWKQNMNKVITALKEVDEETSRILKTVIKALFDIAGAKMKQEMAAGTRNVIDGTKKLVKQSKVKLASLKSQNEEGPDVPDATVPL